MPVAPRGRKRRLDVGPHLASGAIAGAIATLLVASTLGAATGTMTASTTFPPFVGAHKHRATSLTEGGCSWTSAHGASPWNSTTGSGGFSVTAKSKTSCANAAKNSTANYSWAVAYTDLVVRIPASFLTGPGGVIANWSFSYQLFERFKLSNSTCPSNSKFGFCYAFTQADFLAFVSIYDNTTKSWVGGQHAAAYGTWADHYCSANTYWPSCGGLGPTSANISRTWRANVTGMFSSSDTYFVVTEIELYSETQLIGYGGGHSNAWVDASSPGHGYRLHSIRTW